MSDKNHRAQYDKDGSTGSHHSGLGIGGVPADYRWNAYCSIRDTLKNRQVKVKDLGSEYLNLFGHSECQGLSQSFKGDFFIHILICLESYNEVESFKNQVLVVINNYASKISQLKEQVIRRIEKYANDNLNEESKKIFYQESYDVLVKGGKMCDWRETLRFNDVYSNEEIILDYEKSRKELVDGLKVIDDRTSKGEKWDEERKRKYEKEYQNWQNKFKYLSSSKDYSDCKNSPNSDKKAHEITQLKSDIERLKRDLSDPNLTEKEKVEVQEKLDRFEKQLASLENQTNDKDKKISQLEAEIQQLKNQNSGTQTPEQQAENQRKIAEKEQELVKVKDNNQNDNHEKLTEEQLTNEIKKLKAEIAELKNNKNANGDPQAQTELKNKEKRLKDLEQKLKIVKANDTEPDNNFPTNWVVGGGILVALGLVVLLITKKSKRTK